MENEIFCCIESQLKNNHEVYLKNFKLQDLSIEPNPNMSTTYDFHRTLARDSHPCFDALDFCYDICSEFVIPSTKESVMVLFHQHIDKQSTEFENSPESKQIFDFFKKCFV